MSPGRPRGVCEDSELFLLWVAAAHLRNGVDQLPLEWQRLHCSPLLLWSCQTFCTPVSSSQVTTGQYQFFLPMAFLRWLMFWSKRSTPNMNSLYSATTCGRGNLQVLFPLSGVPLCCPQRLVAKARAAYQCYCSVVIPPRHDLRLVREDNRLIVAPCFIEFFNRADGRLAFDTVLPDGPWVVEVLLPRTFISLWEEKSCQ